MMIKKNSRVCNSFWDNVIRQDGLVKNLDGTLSVFIDNGFGVVSPTTISKECCAILTNFKDGVYTYDLDEQKCRWSEGSTNECDINEPYKLILNTRGKDGSLFINNVDEKCSLNIDFDFLIKMECDALSNIIKPKNTALPIGIFNLSDEQTKEQIDLLNKIEVNKLECSNLRNRKIVLDRQLTISRYSIFCEEKPKVITSIDEVGFKKESKKNDNDRNSGDTNDYSKTKNNDFVKEPFTRTGFGGSLGLFNINKYATAKTKTTYCLTEPYGLDKWKEILGQDKYEKFLNGDIDSFSCRDVFRINSENEIILNTVKNGNLLLYSCETEFGTKTNLINEINKLSKSIDDCDRNLVLLNEKYNNTIKEKEVVNFINCNTPIDVLESINASISLDVVDKNGDTHSVYEKNFFPSIGSGNLFNYLSNNENSGFYICGVPSIGEDFVGCFPLDMNFKTKPVLSVVKIDKTNTEKCKLVRKDLRTSLFNESIFKDQEDGLKSFHNSLESNVFNSNWVNYSMVINDESIIRKINNKKIKLSLKINDSCIDFCVLLDKIKLTKVCEVTKKESNLISQSPSFKMKRVVDNKKSWTEEKNRVYNISNVDDTREIRETKYNTDNDKLVINTKEIDLDVNIARGVEVDVYNFIGDYPNILKNKGVCDSCDIQPIIEFQDLVEFNFQNEEIFEYMGNRCCGDYTNFENLISEEIEGLKLSKIKEIIKTELIDSKNRKTINGYATLKSLYERYINSFNYVGVNSSNFNYMNMEKFAYLLGDYWVDLIEQVIPATSLWGSVKIYTNTIFDQQKYVYKEYSLINCEDNFGTEITASPVNFIPTFGVDVDISTVKFVKQYTLNQNFDTKTVKENGIVESFDELNGNSFNERVSNNNLNIKDDKITTIKPNLIDDFVVEEIIDLDIKYQKCNNPIIYQMNSGSEFIGKIKIIK